VSFACDQQTAQLFSYTRRRSSRCIYKRSYKNKREAIRNDQVTLAPLNLDLLLTHQRRVIARGKVFLRENDRGTRPSKRQLTMAALAPGRDYTPALTSQEPPAVVSRKAQLKIRLLAKNQEVRKKCFKKQGGLKIVLMRQPLLCQFLTMKTSKTYQYHRWSGSHNIRNVTYFSGL